MLKQSKRLQTVRAVVITGVFLLCAAVFGVLGTPASHTEAAVGINRQISFQGKLVNPNGTNVTDGSYSILFSIYTAPSGGSSVWSETQTVSVLNGIFQVNLGSVSALPGSVDFNTDNIYLGVKVGSDPEMTPRIIFTAVPQAFNAERLGGLDKSGFLQNGTSPQTASFNVTGSGQIGSTLSVGGAATLSSTLSVSGAATLNSTLAVTGAITGSSTIQGTRFISTVATGTAPFTVASSTMVTNLNADLLDGYHASSFAMASGSGNYIQNGTSPQTASFNVTGTGTIGTLAVTGNATVGGALTVAGTVTGNVLVGNAGVQTGAGVGTMRIDAGGNLVNIANLTMNGNYSDASKGIWTSTTPEFAATANQVAYINLGDFTYTGSIEVSINGQWSAGPSMGKITRLYSFHHAAGAGSMAGYYSDVTQVSGWISNTYALGEIEMNGTSMRIPIYKLDPTATTAIRVTVTGLKGPDYPGHVDTLLANLSLTAPTTVANSATRNIVTYANSGINLQGGGLLTEGTTRITSTGILQNVTYNGATIAGAYGGTGQSTTAVGDLLLGASGNSWSRLGIGGSGSCLVSNGSTASWGSCASGGGLTGSGVNGQVAYFNGTNSQTSSANLLFNGATLTTNMLAVMNGTSVGGALAVTGNATVGGILGVGSGSGEAGIGISGGTDGSERVSFKNGAITNWSIASAGSGTTPEFQLQRFNTSGVYVDTPLAISNTTGAISAANAIVGASTIQGTRFISTVATGTAPLTVTSSTVVANLNADLLDGYHASSFAMASGSGNYIQNGTSPQTANFNVTGSGRVGTTLSVGSTTTQSVVITGGAGTHSIEIGRTDGVAGSTYIDFHSGATPTDYDSRILATAGNGVAGGGNLTLFAAGTYMSGTAYVQGGGAAGTGTQQVATNTYVQSRGTNLVTNGMGQLGNNYNFSGFTFDASEVYAGSGSFRNATMNAVTMSNELIPVNPNSTYQLTLAAKSTTFASGNRAYFGVELQDADGQTIQPYHYMKVGGSSDTTLAAPLNPGDTTMTLASAAGWSNSATGHTRNFRWYGYTNAKGFTYPNYTYSRNVSHSYSDFNTNGAWAVGGISGNTVTLRAPWTGPAVAAGTAINNAQSGGTYKYLGNAVNVEIPNSWTTYSGRIGGIDVNGTGTADKFPHGTASVRLLFLMNREVAGNATNISGISFTDASGVVSNYNPLQPAMIVQGAAGQSSDLLQLQSAVGTVLSRFDSGGNLVVGGTIQGTRIISTVTTGTAPLTVASTTVVANLNADLLDGYHASSFAMASGSNNYIQNGTSPQTANFSINCSGTINDALNTQYVSGIGGYLEVSSSMMYMLSDALYVQSDSGMQLMTNGNFTVADYSYEQEYLSVSTAGAGRVSMLEVSGGAGGSTESWRTLANLPSAIADHSTVTVGKYVYNIGGKNAAGTVLSTVSYARMNAYGGIGSWNSTTSLPGPRFYHSSVAYNGYIYVMAGDNGSGYQSTVYYAKVNGDGTLSSWSTGASVAARIVGGATVVNGYIYIVGGFGDGAVQYAKVNADGSVGAWNTTTYMPGLQFSHSVTAANGYIYSIGSGGCSGATCTYVYYARPNADGSISSWSTSPHSLPVGRANFTTYVANGYIYAVGGYADPNNSAAVYHAPLYSDGSTGVWYGSSNSLPGNRAYHSGFVVGSNAYVIGGRGTAGAAQNTVYFTRLGGLLQVGGSIDLVGAFGDASTSSVEGSGTSWTGSAAGSIIAGNITSVGALQVQGESILSGGLGVLGATSLQGDLNVSGTLKVADKLIVESGGIYMPGVTSGSTGSYVCINTGSGNRLTYGASCSPSSQRYKENIVSMGDALGILGQLRPVSFDWKTSAGHNAANGGIGDYGLIAEEVNLLLPELVTRQEDGSIQGLNYEGFVPFLVRGMQQQQAQIQSLNNKVAQLQGGNQTLTTLVVNGHAQINDLTVTGVARVQSLEVNGTIISRGIAPGTQLGVALGQGSQRIASADGTDSAGTLTVRAGNQNLTTGVLARITFSRPLQNGVSYKTVLSASNETAADLRVYIVRTATGFDVVTRDAPAANTLYQFDYIVIGAQAP